MATSTRQCKQDSGRAPAGLPPVYYQLHTLLHTLRSFEQHEEHLCGLLGEIQRSGKVGARVRKELAAVLEALPVPSLQAEYESTWETLEQAKERDAA